jgi:hypothetical protein
MEGGVPVNCSDLFKKLVEHRHVTATTRDQAREEFAAACRRIDKDPRERQRIADIANLIDTEDAIYTQALSAIGRGEQNTALPLLQQAAEAGIGEAAWLLAGRLEEQGRTQESLTWYRRAAADGDPHAARRILHPLAGRAHIDGYQDASAVPGDAERPVRPRARGLLESGWMTRIVIPATAAAAVVAVVAVVALVATVFQPRGASPRQMTASDTNAGQQLRAMAANRTRAINWIMHQVSRSAVVACDPQVCADLTSKGFPSANLLTLGPQSNDPLGSTLVVATLAIRMQYGNRLASVYAPAIIASFGSGNARIDIRLVFPGGTTSYNAVQRADLRTRRADDAQLLTNRHIAFSAAARRQLRSGDVDPRLLVLIVAMAHAYPLQIVDFSGQSPGGGPASLLRSVDLATADSAAHLTPARYLKWMQRFLRMQRAQFRPAWNRPGTLPTGQAVLNIGYGAPSPLS